MRQARLLLGWLDDTQAAHFLSGQRMGVPLTDEQRGRLNAARAAVAARPVRRDPNDTIRDAPAVLENHIAALQGLPSAQPYFAEGWRVVLADLRQLRTVQPSIYPDRAEATVPAIDSNDIAALAAISLPLLAQQPAQANFDPINKIWVMSSPNLNLQVVGAWSQPVQVAPGNVATAYGFVVAALPSFMQVAKHRDRLVLRDGYHRAHGFLRRGVPIVPAFYREFGDDEQLGFPAGLFAPNIYLGERPPFLPDYTADVVSGEAELPSSERIIALPSVQINQNR